MSPSEHDRLPWGVGRIGRRWAVSAAGLALLVAAGIAAYTQQRVHGDIVTGMRTIGQGGASWGVYIAMYVYFAGISFAGIAAVALARLFRVRSVEPLVRAALVLTVISLVLGVAAVLADLGRPLHGLLYLPAYARTMSPFFGTFTVVSAGYLFSTLVLLYLDGRADAAACLRRRGGRGVLYRMWASGFRGTREEMRRHDAVRFWLCLAILPVLVVEESTLGFVFGIQGGRPGWFSALQAPGFVVLAGASGLGALIVVAAALRHWLDGESAIGEGAFRVLGNSLWVASGTYLYFMLVEELTANYAALEMEQVVAHAVTRGPYAPLFWSTVVLLLLSWAIPFAQFLRRRVSVPGLVAAGILVNLGAIGKRILIVVPSQTHGTLLPYRAGTYVPSAVEATVCLALFAAGSLAFLVFAKLFPILPLTSWEEWAAAPSHRERLARRRLRAALLWSSLAAGLVLAAAGFALSSRAGTAPYADPLVPYSPLLFVAGVMLSFYSAAIYETLPPLPPDAARR